MSADATCDYQKIKGTSAQLMPKKATVRFGVDRTGPAFEASKLEGEAGCPDDSRCLNAKAAGFDLEVTDPLSGVADTQCRIVHPGSNQDDEGWFEGCGTGEGHSFELFGDGLSVVEARGIDRHGNPSGPVELGRFFADTTAPPAPLVQVIPQGEEINDWWTEPPVVQAVAGDEQPSSRFLGDPKPIEVFIDGAPVACGTPVPDEPQAICDASEITPAGEGLHTYTAQSTDRAGNRSPVSEPKTYGVDHTPPTSRLFLGPAKPDGKNGWYVSKPFFAFAASDAASGVDRTKEGSGIRYRIDQGPWEWWNPDNPSDSTIPEGIHTLCWYAVDVANNPETNEHCTDPIKVDRRGPEFSGTITPEEPDGENGWYVTPPVIDGGAEDQPAQPDPSEETSDNVVSEYQIDGGAWKPMGQPFAVPEGVHELRFRAADAAGNVAQLVERTVKVDHSGPSSRAAAFPPFANDQGWFRRPRVLTIAASDGTQGVSGVAERLTRIDANAGDPFAPYAGPFSVGDGLHALEHRARDRAGNLGAIGSQSWKTDLVPPSGKPIGTPAAIVLPGQTSALKFSASELRTPKLRVKVVVFDELEIPVRTLDGGGWREPGTGQVVWNGKNDAGKAVLAGLYHYRVVVTDQAGNHAVSTESPAFLVVLPGLPLL